jgi:FkbM family methyltransferase
MCIASLPGSERAVTLTSLDNRFLSIGSLSRLVRKYRILSRRMDPAIANRLTVMRRQAYGRYPIRIRYHSGERKLVRNELEAYQSIYGLVWPDGPEGEVDFTFEDRALRFVGTKCRRAGQVNGDFLGVFLSEQWAYLLPVTRRTVVDVGANIGDSAIYFLLKGARSVIGIEPFAKSVESARSNCQLNEFANRVTLVQAAMSSQEGISWLEESEYGLSVKADSEKKGSTVEATTIESVVQRLDEDSSAVLKMDCNGCESPVILGAERSLLRRFEKIGIEYVGDPGPIVRKLRVSGFHVKRWSPMIYAVRS